MMHDDWEETHEALKDKVNLTEVPKHRPDLQQKFIEALAALEHDQWMEWAKTIMATEPIGRDRRERWEKLMIPYGDLPEEMKDHDRKWATRVFECVKRHVDD